MFKRKKVAQKNFSEKVAKRVQKLPTADLPSWLEQSLYETNRLLSSYQKTGDTACLEEIMLGAEAVNCLATELYNRTVV